MIRVNGIYFDKRTELKEYYMTDFVEMVFELQNTVDYQIQTECW